MKYLFLTVLLFIMSCSGKPTTIEDLMRSSYYVGCGEYGLKSFGPDVYGDFSQQVRSVLKECKNRSEKFDLRQIGIYDDRMRIYYDNSRNMERK